MKKNVPRRQWMSLSVGTKAATFWRIGCLLSLFPLPNRYDFGPCEALVVAGDPCRATDEKGVVAVTRMEW